VLTSWRYANQYGGHLPVLMVAQTFRNRLTKGVGGSWKEIFENAHKYSATIEQPGGFPDTYDKNFIKILSEIDPIYEGTAKDIVEGAIFFGDTTNITNNWFLENISRNTANHNRTANTSTLTFWD